MGQRGIPGAVKIADASAFNRRFLFCPHGPSFFA
jgi:hypothetical protein